MLAYFAYNEQVLQQGMSVKAYPCKNSLCVTPEHLLLLSEHKRGPKNSNLPALDGKCMLSVNRSQVRIIAALSSLLIIYSLLIAALSSSAATDQEKTAQENSTEKRDRESGKKSTAKKSRMQRKLTPKEKCAHGATGWILSNFHHNA